MPGSSGPGRGVLLRLGDLDDATLSAWDALAGRAVAPNPFFAPAGLLPALRHLDATGDVRLLAVRDGERMLACLPVLPRARWQGTPVRATRTWVHEHLGLGTPLLDGDAPGAAAAGLVEAGQRLGGAFLWLEELAVAGPVPAALRRGALSGGRAVVPWSVYERGALRKGREDERVALAVRGRRLGSKRRALEREVGPVRLVDRSDDPSAVDDLLQQEVAGWKGRAGTALASTPEGAAFFREMCAGLAAEGLLEVLSLESEAGPLAMQANLLAGDTVLHTKSTFAEEHGRRSPGLLLLADVLQRFLDGPQRVWDSCASRNNRVFNSWLPHRQRLEVVVVPRVRPAAVPLRGAAAAAQVRRDRRQRARQARDAAVAAGAAPSAGAQ